MIFANYIHFLLAFFFLLALIKLTQGLQISYRKLLVYLKDREKRINDSIIYWELICLKIPFLCFVVYEEKLVYQISN